MSTHRELVISIHPEYAYLEMKKIKELEARSWIPKNYTGWVNVYITETAPGKNKASQLFRSDSAAYDGIQKTVGKISYRFLFVNYVEWPVIREKLIYHRKYCSLRVCQNLESYQLSALLQDSCLEQSEFDKIRKHHQKMFFWYISKLEIFDRPRSLSEFGLKKAPQKCAWVQVED